MFGDRLLPFLVSWRPLGLLLNPLRCDTPSVGPQPMA